MLWIKFMDTFCEIVPMWMSQNISDDKSTLVQVMASCRQAPFIASGIEYEYKTTNSQTRDDLTVLIW